MATCLELSGASYPATVNGVNITRYEGKSLAPAFANGPIERDAIFWEHEGNRAVRTGDWKLVAKSPGGKWELYNIPADRAEAKDLAAEHPERVKELREKWEAWASRAQVVPWIWTPEYKQ
jgi:arylsulfatase